MKKIVSLSILILLMLILVSCGGGGGGAGGTTVTTNPINTVSSAFISGNIYDITTNNSSVSKNNTRKVTSMSSVRVSVKDTNISTTTDSFGYYVLEVPNSNIVGNLKLNVLDETKDLNFDFDITLENGNSLTVDFDLKKEGNTWTKTPYVARSNYTGDLNHDLWNGGYFADISSILPDNYGKYQDNNGQTTINTFIDFQFNNNGTYEDVYLGVELNDQKNLASFLIDLNNGNLDDSSFTIWDKNSNLYGSIFVKQGQVLTLKLTNPISVKDIYSSMIIGQDRLINMEFDGYDISMNAYEKLIGFESINTSAGTFEDCAKIQTKYEDGSRLITWYAKNVGEVKTISYNNDLTLDYSEELIEYNIQNEKISLPQTKKDWTVMVYAYSDDSENNDLTIQILNSEIAELTKVGSGNNINIIFQIQPSQNNNELATIYNEDLLVSNTTSYVINGNVIKLRRNFNKNVGDQENLVEFVSYCKTNFPADNYMLSLSGHGAGSIANYSNYNNSPNKITAFSETYNDVLTYSELNNAFSQIKTILGKNIDILVMNACEMATVELAYELKDTVDCIVASKFSTIGVLISNGLNAIKTSIVQYSDLELAKMMVDESTDYYNSIQKIGTFSIIDPSVIDANFINNCALLALNPNLMSILLTNQLDDPEYFASTTLYNHQIDFFYLMELIASNPTLFQQVYMNAYNLYQYKDTLVPYHKKTNNLNNYLDSGISVFWPIYSNTSVASDEFNYYQNSQYKPSFEIDTGWSNLFY